MEATACPASVWRRKNSSPPHVPLSFCFSFSLCSCSSSKHTCSTCISAGTLYTLPRLLCHFLSVKRQFYRSRPAYVTELTAVVIMGTARMGDIYVYTHDTYDIVAHVHCLTSRYINQYVAEVCVCVYMYCVFLSIARDNACTPNVRH